MKVRFRVRSRPRVRSIRFHHLNFQILQRRSVLFWQPADFVL